MRQTCKTCKQEFNECKSYRAHCYRCLPYGKRPDTLEGKRLVCSVCKKSYIYNRKSNHILSSDRCSCCVRDEKRFLNKKLAVEYLGGRCIICGYNKSLAAMVFHHKKPNNKIDHIAAMLVCCSWAKIQSELDKCELLCCRCHTEKHDRWLGRWHAACNLPS